MWKALLTLKLQENQQGVCGWGWRASGHPTSPHVRRHVQRAWLQQGLTTEPLGGQVRGGVGPGLPGSATCTQNGSFQRLDLPSNAGQWRTGRA